MNMNTVTQSGKFFFSATHPSFRSFELSHFWQIVPWNCILLNKNQYKALQKLNYITSFCHMVSEVKLLSGQNGTVAAMRVNAFN